MIENIVDIAERAGKIILSHYEEVTPGIIRKEDNSPLTQADLAAHELILSGLKELTPEIPVISEEGEIAGYEERRSWKQFWLVDPLDGTRECIKKNGERSEEHTSELQSRGHLVCRLLLEKKS